MQAIEPIQINENDNGRCQIREHKGGAINDVVSDGSVGDNLPALPLTLCVANENNDQKEATQNERWDISEHNILGHELHQIQVLARCEGFLVDQSGDEDNPKVGCHAECHPADYTHSAEEAVGLVDVAQHLTGRIQQFVDQQECQYLHDGDLVMSPLAHENTHEGEQEQHHRCWAYYIGVVYADVDPTHLC